MQYAAQGFSWSKVGKKFEQLQDKMEDLAEKAQEKASGWCCCASVDKEGEINLPEAARRLEVQ